MSTLVRHLIPPFDSWWPNVYAMIWTTPLTVVLVWISHRQSIGHMKKHISMEIRRVLRREDQDDQGFGPR